MVIPAPRSASMAARVFSCAVGGGRRPRPGGGAAGPLFGVPWIPGPAPEPAVPRRQRAHRQLGDEHRARVRELRVDGGVLVDHLVAVGRSPPGGLRPLDREQVLRAPGDPVERAAVVPGGDLRIGPGGLLAGEVLGQVHHAQQDRIEFLQARQVELGEFRGGDLAGLDEPREVGHRKEGEVGVRLGTRDLGPGRLHPAGRFRHRLARGQRMEDEGRRLVVVDLGIPDALVRLQRVALAVQPLGHQ